MEASPNQGADQQILLYNPLAKIFFRVINMQLKGCLYVFHTNPSFTPVNIVNISIQGQETGQVYVQITLVPEAEVGFFGYYG